MSHEQFLNLCDTWETLDYFQTCNKAKLTINQLNSFEEVKDFLESIIAKVDVEDESAESYTNIDSIIDKLKGS